MIKQPFRSLLFLFSMFLVSMDLCGGAHAFQQADILGWQYPTDREIVELAIAKGFLTPDLSDEAVRGETATLWKVWIVHSRAEKIELIESVKSSFAEADNAVIRKSAAYYVDEINIRILNLLKEERLDYFNSIPFHTLFKSLAIIEGDYDDGRTPPLELIRNWFGETGVEQMKENFPERYEALKRDGQR